MAIIGKGLGVDLEVVEVNETEGLDIFTNLNGVAEHMTGQQVKTMKKAANEVASIYNGERYKEAIHNIKKYRGKPATLFLSWVKENKEIFTEQ